MDLGVKSLHPAGEHLGETGDLLNECHRHAVFFQQRGRSPGGDDLDSEFVNQRPGEIDDAGLVVNANQRTLNLISGHGSYGTRIGRSCHMAIG